MPSGRVPAFALAALLLPGALATAAEPLLDMPCSALVPGDTGLVDTSCARIHPGGAVIVGGAFCTMNFVVTDGVDLFIGTAGHCVGGTGARARTPGGPEFGTVALDGHGGDWAFIRIDRAMHADVDPSLAQWGGPTTIRAPLLAGEPVLHYGHGASLGQIPETRGRVGEVLVAGADATTFVFAGSVDSGDSGSPVMILTGEAAGIAVATIFAQGVPVPITIATRFDLAADELSDALGRPVTVVQGQPRLRP